MLSDTVIRRFAARGKRYEVHDDAGLYLEVMPTGDKYWRIRISMNGTRIRRTLGKYPTVSLATARRCRDEIRLKVAMGENPFAKVSGRSFESVAREWLAVKVLPIRTQNHIRTVVSRLERLVFPFIGAVPARAVTPMDLLEVLRRIEAGGSHETAHRVRQICGQVFRFGISIGQADRDIAADLDGALIPLPDRHFPTITDPGEIRALMRAIDGLNGSLMVRCALRFQALTFVRPGELRHAEWKEIDFGKREWRIPAEKMKMKKLHLVPLSWQAMNVLEELRPVTSAGKYLFPALRSSDRPMSDATVNAALRRLGYGQDQFTGHSFRSMASTILNEHQWNRDWIERQLAHVEGNSVRAAYNYAEHLPERREMMQWWGNWLDEQK